MSKIGQNGADLLEFAKRLLGDGPRRVQPASRRVRVIHNGATIVDTVKALHVWEHDYYPQFYIPLSDLKKSQWHDGDYVTVRVPGGNQIEAFQLELSVPGAEGRKDVQTNRVLRFALHTADSGNSSGAEGEQKSHAHDLIGMADIRFWKDHWLEEDVPIYVHPKDPYKRVDLLSSTRPIEVRVEGKTVAKSSFSVHLHETGLPTRYYLPPTSVDQAVLRPSELTTRCPYKGQAQYYHVDVGDDRLHNNAVWYYKYPTIESAGIAGLLCFYNEKVDILLDGELLERPKTVFS
ncbi:hypothetical protein HJFPF1_09777 [Paramyrothecium foliicola]|nr:hypothetical protein HJFPF1_09777 [Paramyrothecium foliicola]